MYLFDTDTICNILKKRPSEKLLAKFKTLPFTQQFISTITISEIVYGALRSSRADYHMRNLEEVLLPNVNVLSFDSKSGYLCGRLRHELERRGRTISFADMQIAAVALSHDMTLVTGNVKHFMGIEGLPVENWL